MLKESTQLAAGMVDLYMTVFRYVKKSTDGRSDGAFIYDRIKVC